MVTVIRRHGPEVFQISGARPSLSEDVRGRERRYVISMLIRTVSVLLTVALWNVSRPLAIGLLVLGVAVPYVAVVIANAGRENSPAIPSSLLAAPSRPRIGPGTDADPGAEPSPPSADGPSRAEGQGRPTTDPKPNRPPESGG